MKFKVTYHLEVGIEPDVDINGLDLFLISEIPFAPFEGLMVIPVIGDDYREVDQVQWSGEAFDVYFKFDKGRSGHAWVKTLKKKGWKEMP